MVRAESVTATLVYTYTASGLRVAQSVDGDVTTFAWDWASGVPEMLRDGENLYLVGHDTLGRFADGEWAYYLPDALGSVRQVVDGAGAVVSAREWTPYGAEVGAGQAGLGYTGEWWDGDVGLLYLRARWYAPGTGRFTQGDVWHGNQQQPLTMNPYLYALANPVLLYDPSGYGPKEDIQDVSGRLAVLWYRERYLASIIRYSQEFSIDRVELEAGLYTMGGFEGFISDVLRKHAGFRQDIAWHDIAVLLTIGSCVPSPISDLLEKLAASAAVPSLGIAQIDPPDAIAVEEYWAEQGGPELFPYADQSYREEYLTRPWVGVRYLAAYVGWSRKELERFTNETGGTMKFSQECEWWFIGKIINGGNPTNEVYNLVNAFQDEGMSGLRSYWDERIGPDNKNKTGTLYVKYMRSPLPQHLKLSNLRQYLNPQ
jgi:RHS repeat-associated protein